MYNISGTKAPDKKIELANTSELAETVVCSMKFKLIVLYTEYCWKKQKKESSVHQKRKKIKLTADN